MKNLKKKAVIVMASVSLAAGMLTGCADFDNSETAVVVGGDEVPAGVANFYARYHQAMIETSLKSMLGDNMWTQDVGEGKTYEQQVKDGVMDTLQQLYILEDHMDEYGVSLSDEEKEAIKKAAFKFDESNRLESKKLVSAEKEYVERILTLLTIQNKMSDAMTKDVNTEVSDEEAAQKSMQYVKFPFTTTDADGASKQLTEEEKTGLMDTASGFLMGAREVEDFAAYAEAAGYEVQTATFDAESVVPDAKLVKEADALEEGAFSTVVETETGLYVAKVTSLLDREATDNKKEAIVDRRKSEKYNEIYEGWKNSTKIEVNEEVWKKVDFQSVGVINKPKETKEIK